MKYFVTGAFGFIGQQLCQRLAESGCEVVAFCRNRNKQLPFENQKIVLVEGDIRDSSTLTQMAGCDGVFHLASLAQLWSPRVQDFYDVNVGGTLNVLRMAHQLGIKKMVYTSTAGVYGPCSHGDVMDEQAEQKPDHKTDYEKSKQQSEIEVRRFIQETGLPVVIVNPTRVYGPGHLSSSNAITKLVKRFCNGGIQPVPNIGKYVGNYVYIDDVVDGHLLAMSGGYAGSNYLLAGTNASFAELFLAIEEAARVRSTQIPIPLFLIKSFAVAHAWRARMFGTQPLITPEFVRKYSTHNAFTSQKMADEFGYEPTPLKQGLQRTVDWLRKPVA